MPFTLARTNVSAAPARPSVRSTNLSSYSRRALQVTSLSNIFEQMSRGESESDAVLLVSSEAGSSIQTR